MKLIIDDVSDVKESFCPFIIHIARLMLNHRFDKKKVSNINKYFTEVFPHPQLNGDAYNATDILVEAFNNLRYMNEKDGKFVIYIDEEMNYKNYPIKLITLCKEINFGGMGVRGYPIITDVFQQIQLDMRRYKNMYKLGYNKSKKGEDTE